MFLMRLRIEIISSMQREVEKYILFCCLVICLVSLCVWCSGRLTGFQEMWQSTRETGLSSLLLAAKVAWIPSGALCYLLVLLIAVTDVDYMSLNENTVTYKCT